MISDALETFEEELGEVKDLVRRLQERGQAWQEQALCFHLSVSSCLRGPSSSGMRGIF